MNKNLLILGAGQYGQVAKEAAESMGCFDKIDFLDDAVETAIGKLNDYEKFSDRYAYAFVAIGNAELRLSYVSRLEESCYRIAILVSRDSYVSPSAQLMKGTLIEPMVTVGANSAVCVSAFLCAGSTVGHNSFVGDGCQLDYGSVVGSNAVLPAKTKLKCNEVFDSEKSAAVLTKESYLREKTGEE